MKMKKNFRYAGLLACAALAVGLTGCSKEDNNPQGNSGSNVAGLPAKVELSIEMAQTRSGLLNGIAEENKIGEISIWIYDANDPTGKKSTIVHSSTFDAQTKGVKKIDIETTSGPKNIYVGVNLPASMKSIITSAGRDGVNNVIYQIPLNELSQVNIGGETYFAMFAQNVQTATLEAQEKLSDPTPEANKIKLTVERLVSKIAVGKNSAVETMAVTSNAEMGGAFDTDNMEYSVKQINKSTFITRQSIDPNYDGFAYGWDYTTSSGTGPDVTADYGLEAFSNELGYQKMTVVAGLNDTEEFWNKDVNRFYTPENLERVGRLGSNTYAVIKVKYTPDPANMKPGTAAKAGDFVTLKDQNNKIEFYPSVADAETARQAKTTPADWVVSGLYEEGYNYYRVYLVKETEYNVVRNTFYRVRVNSINDLGSWRESNPGPGGPEEPGKPIEEDNTKVDVTIEVLPWYMLDVVETELK